jgi:rare lipoprotein A (peptidoglycan hydrolase)
MEKESPIIVSRRKFMQLLSITIGGIAYSTLRPNLGLAEEVIEESTTPNLVDDDRVIPFTRGDRPVNSLLYKYEITDLYWEGIASYYSKNGCLGCRADQMMANGEIFDENKLTLAFMRTALNSQVLVENLENGLTVMAKVADRGGFEAWEGRIADLSLGLKNAIEGSHLTPVRITLLRQKDVTPDNPAVFWPGWDDGAYG